MFFYTDTADAPWTFIKSDDKKRARLACLQHFLSSLPYPDRDNGSGRGSGPDDRRPGERGRGPQRADGFGRLTNGSARPAAR